MGRLARIGSLEHRWTPVVNAPLWRPRSNRAHCFRPWRMVPVITCWMTPGRSTVGVDAVVPLRRAPNSMS